MNATRPSQLELQVLSVLWTHGPLTARAVLERMPDGKPRAYTTVLSVLQVMEKKGFVSHQSEGNKHVYQAAVEQGSVLKPMFRSLIKNLFGGKASAAMQHLLEDNHVSDSELAEMKQLISQYEEQRTRNQSR